MKNFLFLLSVPFVVICNSPMFDKLCKQLKNTFNQSKFKVPSKILFVILHYLKIFSSHALDWRRYAAHHWCQQWHDDSDDNRKRRRGCQPNFLCERFGAVLSTGRLYLRRRVPAGWKRTGSHHNTRSSALRIFSVASSFAVAEKRVHRLGNTYRPGDGANCRPQDPKCHRADQGQTRRLGHQRKNEYFQVIRSQRFEHHLSPAI